MAAALALPQNREGPWCPGRHSHPVALACPLPLALSPLLPAPPCTLPHLQPVLQNMSSALASLLSSGPGLASMSLGGCAGDRYVSSEHHLHGPGQRGRQGWGRSGLCLVLTFGGEEGAPEALLLASISSPLWQAAPRSPASPQPPTRLRTPLQCHTAPCSCTPAHSSGAPCTNAPAVCRSHCIQQILEAVLHCHQMGVVHRDLKVSPPPALCQVSVICNCMPCFTGDSGVGQ